MNAKFRVIFALISVLVASMACNFFTNGSRELSLDNLHMALDQDGNSPTTVFESNDVFYVVGELKNAPLGTVVEAKWLAAQIEGYQTNELIYEQAIDDFTEDRFSGTIYFQLSNESGWPIGEYAVEVYLNSNYIDTVSFQVQ